MKKILIVSDLHFGKSRESTTNPGLVRQANTQAKDTFGSMVPKFKTIDPDLMVNMGDILRDTYIEEIDTQNMTQAISLVESVDATTIHLLGNHELRAFKYSDASKIYDSVIKEHDFFGVMDLGNFQILWLDLELDEDNLAYLSDARLEWLKEVDEQKPTILFSHYSIEPLDAKGSFYFENEPEGMYYKNFSAIKNVLSSLNIKLCINAHVHLLTHQQIGEKHHISNPAFSENIAADKYPENNPGIYSILEFDEDQFIFTSYSGEFCFAKIQGKF